MHFGGWGKAVVVGIGDKVPIDAPSWRGPDDLTLKRTTHVPSQRDFVVLQMGTSGGGGNGGAAQLPVKGGGGRTVQLLQSSSSPNDDESLFNPKQRI